MIPGNRTVTVVTNRPEVGLDYHREVVPITNYDVLYVVEHLLNTYVQHINSRSRRYAMALGLQSASGT